MKKILALFLLSSIFISIEAADRVQQARQLLKEIEADSDNQRR